MRIRWEHKQSSWSSSARARAGLPESGYTFVEVLVAAVLLGLVGTTLYGAFAAGFCVIQTTQENLRATQILVQKTEAVRLFTWSQVADTNNYLKFSFTENYDPLGTTNNTGGAKYTGTVRASVPAAGEVPEAYRTNMRTLTVTLYWTNYNGGKAVVHQREMQTRVARNGMQNYLWGAL
jgi:hypothetical protein